MFALAGNLLRTLAPSAINWGMNKLMGSNIGKRFVAPLLQNPITQGLINKGQQLMSAKSPSFGAVMN